MLRALLLSVMLICGVLATPPVMAKGQTEINELQEQLVSLAKKLRRGEERLAALASKQAKLDKRITDARKQIDTSKEEIDALLQSLIRLSRTPPEAVVAMPGELRQTLQAAQLMTQLTEKLQKKTAELSTLLKTLKADELALAENRESLQQQQERLIASQKALEEKVTKRRLAYQLNNKNYKKQAKEAKQVKKSSRNVKQLVTKLEKKQQTKVVSQGLPFSKRRGRLNLPVAGHITKRFGQKEGVDQTSHGYHLASASGATVVSPASGEVMFTGPFLDYGNIVILRYDRGYHLLLAGLERIDCSVGQKVLTGEPVGRLRTGQSSRSSLYMELRKNGKPVDPSPWFG